MSLIGARGCPRSRRKLAGVVLTLTFMVFEGAFAIVAGSLAMLGDAAHMLSGGAWR